jgi:hypothetical protein
MPGLARKILIFAALDGIILQPQAPRGQRPAPSVQIAYNGNSILTSLNRGEEEDRPGKAFEAFGIVGTSRSQTAYRYKPS